MVNQRTNVVVHELVGDHSYSMYDHVIKRVRRISLGNCIVPECEAEGLALDSPEAIARGAELLDMLGIGARMDFDVISPLAIPAPRPHN